MRNGTGDAFWLVGLGALSTLTWLPGIALLAAGSLAPLATVVLVAAILFGALPVFRNVAKRDGTIAVLDEVAPGRAGQVAVLALVGFATMALVYTLTLCASDAAQHVVENPLLAPLLRGGRTPIAIALLALPALAVLRGFRVTNGIAGWVCIPWLVLSVGVLARGGWEIAHQPEALADWQRALSQKGGAPTLGLLALFAFPGLAIGLAGFEPGALPRARGTGGQPPIAVAGIACALFLAASFVTAILVPPEVWGATASGRALAWTAHRYLGPAFGTVYDVSTILVLLLASASAMTALPALLRAHLPRFGIASRWVDRDRPLIVVALTLSVAVTLLFQSDVEASAGALATSALALLLGGAVAVALAERSAMAAYYTAIAVVFALTLAENVSARPAGLVLTCVLLVAIAIVGAVSRRRSISRST